MQARRLMAVFLRQVYLLRGSATRVVPLFVWVAIDILLWGFITRYLNTQTQGLDFVPTLLGAVLLWDFLIRVMQGVTMAFFEDVWSRNFLNFFATPLRISEYLGGLILSSIVTSAFGLAFMLAMATGFFGLSFFAHGAAMVAFLLILFVCGIALGVLGSALVLRLGPSAEWFVWPIPALVSPFACVFYPLSVLPEWMQWIARAIPPSHVFEGMRALTAGQGFAAREAWIGLGLSLLYLLLACLVFTRTYRHAVRSGLIARYSAETVN